MNRAYIVAVAHSLVASHGFHINEAFRSMTWQTSSDIMDLGYAPAEAAALIATVRDKRVEYEGYYADGRS